MRIAMIEYKLVVKNEYMWECGRVTSSTKCGIFIELMLVNISWYCKANMFADFRVKRKWIIANEISKREW